MLNYRRIPYRTEWISYPRIKETFIQLGFQPTRREFDGGPLYTVPSIIDHQTTPPTLLSDSTPIAQYLEKAYAEGPKLFPEGTEARQLQFIESMHVPGGFEDSVSFLMMPLTSQNLYFPEDEEYFNRTKHGRFGVSMADMCPAGSVERRECWDAVKKSLDAMAAFYDSNVEGGGEFAVGKTVTYADVVVAAILLWTQVIPSDRDGPGVTSLWELIAPLNGGKWERLLSKFDDFRSV